MDDSLILNGDDLDNSIDDLPGVFDYSYSRAAGRARECAVGLVVIKSALVVLLVGLI